MGTAKVLITDAVGNCHLVRAVLDSGSQTSAITLVCVKQLGLKMSRSRIEVIGIPSDKANTRGITCQISSRFDHTKILSITPVVLNSIVSELPTQEIVQIKEMRNLRLADDEYYRPSSIDIIIYIYRLD